MKLRYAIAFLALIAVFGFVGSMDYEDAIAEHEHYEAMVCAGHWPDYDNRKPDCEEISKWKTEKRTF